MTAGNVGYSDNIYTFPYFCSLLIKEYLKWVMKSDQEKKEEFGLDDIEHSE